MNFLLRAVLTLTLVVFAPQVIVSPAHADCRHKIVRQGPSPILAYVYSSNRKHRWKSE